MSFGGAPPPVAAPTPPPAVAPISPGTAKPPRKSMEPSFIGAALTPTQNQTGGLSLIGGAR